MNIHSEQGSEWPAINLDRELKPSSPKGLPPEKNISHASFATTETVQLWTLTYPTPVIQ